MGLFWILLILSIGFLTGFIVCLCKEEEDIVAMLILPAVVSGFLAICFIVDGTDGDRIKDETETEATYSLIVEKINAYPTDANFKLLDEIYDECVVMDTKISNHKRLHMSKWRGVLYSEKIGNVSDLRLKSEACGARQGYGTSLH